MLGFLLAFINSCNFNFELLFWASSNVNNWIWSNEKTSLKKQSYSDKFDFDWLLYCFLPIFSVWKFQKKTVESLSYKFFYFFPLLIEMWVQFSNFVHIGIKFAVSIKMNHLGLYFANSCFFFKNNFDCSVLDNIRVYVVSERWWERLPNSYSVLIEFVWWEPVGWYFW
jgi:hypothetical protein